MNRNILSLKGHSRVLVVEFFIDKRGLDKSWGERISIYIGAELDI